MPNCCSLDSLILQVETSFQYESSENCGTFPCFSSKEAFSQLFQLLLIPNNTASMLDTVCALEKILLLHNKRFNHQDQRCGTKGVTFTLLLQFTKERVSKASLKHPHILQRALLFHRHFSEASATQLPKTVAKVPAKQGSLVCQKVCQPRLLKPRKLSRYV